MKKRLVSLLTSGIMAAMLLGLFLAGCSGEKKAEAPAPAPQKVEEPKAAAEAPAAAEAEQSDEDKFGC